MKITRNRRWISFFCSIVLVANLLTMIVPSIALAGSGQTYTLDADFDQGTLLNVNHDAPNNNQLQLNVTTRPFPFVNIAASARGTIVRIDVNSGDIVGEYLSAPDGMGRNPSRTTVDQLGNVWVANRDEWGWSGGQEKGSVVRIGLVIGGTRVDADGTPNPAGQYLKPPFEYNTCVDRDGDGLIKTSIGLSNVLTWSNIGGVDSDGGVSTADDEAIINYTRVTGTGTRSLAVDANNDLWVGGLYNSAHEKLSGITGQPIAGTQFNLGMGGYGALIDRNGILWSAPSPLLRFDPSTMTGIGLGWETVGYTYGLGIDPNTGHIWTTDNSWPLNVRELDPLTGTTLNKYLMPVSNGWAQGIVVDGNSHVWAAEGFGDEVAHFAPDPENPGKHVFVGSVTGFAGTTGVAVDANGKIWASEMNGNSASRIDPNAGPIGAGGYNVGAIDMTVSLGMGAGPYNYSDMTGFLAIGATSPQGTWTVAQDSGAAGTSWGTITWNTEPEGNEPAGTSIIVEARSADTQAGLSSQLFVPASNGAPISLTGRFIEVRTTLKAASDGTSPVLSDLTVKTVGDQDANTPGKVTGGGWIDGAKKTAGKSFGFVAKYAQGDASPSGQFEFNNHITGDKFHSEEITSLVIDHTAKTATFAGKGKLNGVSGSSFKVTVSDLGEPGVGKDTFEISIDDSVVGSNKLSGGNIQIHEE